MVLRPTTRIAALAFWSACCLGAMGLGCGDAGDPASAGNDEPDAVAGLDLDVGTDWPEVSGADGTKGDAGATPDSTADASADDSLAPELVEGLELIRAVMSPPPVDTVVPLEDGSVLTLSEGQLMRMDGDQVTLLATEIERLIGGAWLEDEGTFVVAMDESLWVFHEEALVHSPIASTLDGHALMGFQMSYEGGGSTLWLATPGGLYRWRQGATQRVEPEGLPADAATIVVGRAAPGGGQGTPLWVSSQGQLYALVSHPDQDLVAWLERDDFGVVDALAADQEGRLWLVAEGALHQRDAHGVWREIIWGQSVLGLAAHPRGAGTWLHLAGGALVYVAAGLWQLAPDAVNWTGIVARPEHGVLGVGPDGLEQVDAERFVSLDGLEAEQVLRVHPVAVKILPDVPEAVTGVAATIDGQGLGVSTPDWELLLDPNGLATGSHALEVSVTYSDLENPVRVSRAFTVDPVPTWNADIEPLYVARCDACHSPAAISEDNVLNTSERWRQRIDLIILAVETGAMPLSGSPLGQEEIALIKLWRDAGMPE